LRNIIEEKGCDKKHEDKHEKPCACEECGTCVEASCERCDAPVVEKVLNAIYTKLPKSLNFVFPNPRCETLAEIVANDCEKDADIDAWELKVMNALASLIVSLKSNGLSADAFEKLYRNTKISLGDTLYESLLVNSIAALNHNQYNCATQENVDDTIETVLNLFGSGISYVRPFNYFVRLPRDSNHAIDMELPLKWITASLISKITNKLNAAGTAPYVAFSGYDRRCHNEDEIVEIGMDALRNASTGVVNIRVRLYIDSQGNVVKNYASPKPVQNTSDFDSERKNSCEPTSDVVFEYNFYFIVDQGKLISGLVFLNNGKRDYTVISILPYKRSALGLRQDRFYFAVPTLGNASAVSATYPNNVLALLPAGTTAGTITPTTQAKYVPVHEFLDDLVISTIVYEPVFTPATLLSFTPSCDDHECEKTWLMVNKSGFNL